MVATIEIINVSIVHEDAGLKNGDKYEAVIGNLENGNVKMAKFPIKGIMHHAWILLDPDEKQLDGLTYAKFVN